MTLHRALEMGKPIIIAMQSTPMVGHVVVLRGMSFATGPRGEIIPILHINDPMAYWTQPVPYAQILPYWREAIVVEPR